MSSQQPIMIKRKRGRPRLYKGLNESDRLIPKINGDETAYFIATSTNEKKNPNMVVEFAGESWIVSASKPTEEKKSVYTGELLQKSEHRLRAPNKKKFKELTKSPEEHIQTIKFSNQKQTHATTEPMENKQNYLELLQKRLYNFHSKRYNRTQINNKLMTLKKNSKKVTLRAVFELTKSLPKAKDILDSFSQKNGPDSVSYVVEDSLLLEYMLQERKSKKLDVKLKKLGVGSERRSRLIKEFEEYKKTHRNPQFLLTPCTKSLYFFPDTVKQENFNPSTKITDFIKTDGNFNITKNSAVFNAVIKPEKTDNKEAK